MKHALSSKTETHLILQRFHRLTVQVNFPGFHHLVENKNREFQHLGASVRFYYNLEKSIRVSSLGISDTSSTNKQEEVLSVDSEHEYGSISDILSREGRSASESPCKLLLSSLALSFIKRMDNDDEIENRAPY